MWDNKLTTQVPATEQALFSRIWLQMPVYLSDSASEVHKVVTHVLCTAATDGVVLATEKKQKSILYDDQTIHKVEQITHNLGMVYSGMGPDYRYETACIVITAMTVSSIIFICLLSC